MIIPGVTGEAAALVEQGIAAARTGNKEGAKELLYRAVEMDPMNEPAWLWLASLYTELPMVAHCLRQVLAINPSNPQANQVLQAVTRRMEAEQLQQVAPHVEHVEHDFTAVERPADEDLSSLSYDELKRRGIVAAKGGRQEEAKACLLAATDKNDSDAETWYWLSTVLADPEDKQIALENTLTLDPMNPAATAAMEENAYLLEQVRNGTYVPPAPKYPSGPLVWETSPAAEPQPAPQPAAHIEPAHGPLPGVASKLFAHVGESNRPVTDSAAPPMIAGKYRILSETESNGYVVWEPKKQQFFILQPHYMGMDDLKKNNVSYIVHAGDPYVLAPINTDNLTLRSFVSTAGSLPPELVAQYGMTLLKSLAVEHEKGPIVTARRYITPDTVALDATGQVVLEPPGNQPPYSANSSLVAPFLPTEQLQNGALAPTSDIYAIGALLFFMLTGSPPPPQDRRPVKQAGTLEPGYFPDHPEIPEDLARVVATALQPNPGERYATANEMAKALRSTSAGRSIPMELPMQQIGIGAAVLVGLLALGWIVTSGVLRNVSLPFLNQAGAVAPTAIPEPVVVATPVPPPPLGRVIVNSVDSRKFPLSTLYFSALNTEGAPMLGLDRSSVKLVENGAEINQVQFTELRRTTDAISVIVALDTSDRMKGKTMDDAKTAIHIFTDLIQPGDRMALLTFGGGAAQPALDYTVSKSQFLAAVDGQQGNGAAAVTDAVALGATRAMTQLQGGYTALVIVSNGGLPKAKPPLDEMVRAANSANMPIYYVGLDKATYPAEAAEQLTSRTGGFAVVADVADAGGAAEAMKKVERQLHNVYKVMYDAPVRDPRAEHTLELTVTARDVTLGDKRSYLVWK
jgi:serine/threonine protein kinase/Mg-chelatase subunit ChlD